LDIALVLVFEFDFALAVMESIFSSAARRTSSSRRPSGEQYIERDAPGPLLGIFERRAEDCPQGRRRIAMAIKIAHFPTACDRDDFDFAARLSLDPRQIGEFARSRWVAHGEALLRWGHAAGTQEARHDGALHPRHRQSGRPPYVKFI
jgi:hypothetical protein